MSENKILTKIGLVTQNDKRLLVELLTKIFEVEREIHYSTEKLRVHHKDDNDKVQAYLLSIEERENNLNKEVLHAIFDLSNNQENLIEESTKSINADTQKQIDILIQKQNELIKENAALKNLINEQVKDIKNEMAVMEELLRLLTANQMITNISGNLKS